MCLCILWVKDTYLTAGLQNGNLHYVVCRPCFMRCMRRPAGWETSCELCHYCAPLVRCQMTDVEYISHAAFSEGIIIKPVKCVLLSYSVETFQSHRHIAHTGFVICLVDLSTVCFVFSCLVFSFFQPKSTKTNPLSIFGKWCHLLLFSLHFTR